MTKFKCYGDASHWGYTDLYDNVRNDLEALINSGEPFATDWLSSKKECGSWRLTRDEARGDMSVEVSASMDEPEALVYDACSDCGIPEELVAGAVDDLVGIYLNSDDEITTESVVIYSDTMPGDSSLRDVLTKVDYLAGAASDTLERWYDSMRDIVSVYAGLKKKLLDKYNK